eukprot:sb/3467077/
MFARKSPIHRLAPRPHLRNGPWGTYEHDVQRFRRVEFAGSFGGKQRLKETITVKCVNNNDDIPTNKLGYSLGARTANRFPNLKCKNGYFAHDLSRDLELTFPGPTSYQKEEKKVVSLNKEPFNNSAGRFPAESKATMYLPAPGTYEHDVQRFRRVEFAGSFGGKQRLKETITVKCVNNNDDICDSCNRPPIGDYFVYKNKALCRNCHSFHSVYGEKYPPSYLQAFSKVRDCSEIHFHEGTSAKIKLKDTKLETKQRYREAYFAHKTGIVPIANLFLYFILSSPFSVSLSVSSSHSLSDHSLSKTIINLVK